MVMHSVSQRYYPGPAGDPAAHARPVARSCDALDEPVGFWRDSQAIRVSRPVRSCGRALRIRPAPALGYRHIDLRCGRSRQLYRPGRRQGHTCGGRRRVDAGWPRHVARRRSRQSRPDARLPAVDRPAAGTRIGADLKHLSGPRDVPEDGPARILLGSYGSASSTIVSPSSINYLAVRLKAGERWRYAPPTDHTVLWAAVLSGTVSVPDELRQGELAAFEQSSGAVEFEARTDAEFVLGSAVPHNHDLVLGSHSVHTTRAALRTAQAHISALRTQLVKEGRF